MNRTRNAGRIFLVYSADRRDLIGVADRTERFHREWSQMELFPTPSPETLVFVRPDDGDLFDTIRTAGAKHVLDIRDVPYLTLSGLDRGRFFSELRTLVVDYLGVHALVHKAGSGSVSEFLAEALDSDNRTRDLESTLVQKLASGPTVVMCDEDPGADTKVGALLDYLSRKQMKHKPVLAVQ